MFRMIPTALIGLGLTSLLVLSACYDKPPTEPTAGPAFAPGGGGPPPKVDAADPSSAPQDITLDVRVLGSGFDDGSEATFTLDGTPTPKVKTNHTQFVNPSELRANITIAVDAVIDFYDIEVVTTRGKKGIGADKFQVVAKGGVGNIPADPEIAIGGYGPGLSVVNADGSNLTTLLSEGQYNMQPTWAPFGNGTASDPYVIAFAGCDSLEMIDVDTVGGIPRALNRRTVPTTTTAVCDPAWSPVGDEIAYGGWQEGPDALFVIPVSGGPPTALYTPPSGDAVLYPAWEPSGQAIAFNHNFAGPTSAFRIFNRPTGTVTTIIESGELGDRGGRGFQGNSWARTRDELSFQLDGRAYTITLVRDGNGDFIRGGDPVFVARVGLSGTSWSPDDTHLAVSDRNNKNVWAYEFATGDTHRLGGGRWPDWRR